MGVLRILAASQQEAAPILDPALFQRILGVVVWDYFLLSMEEGGLARRQRDLYRAR